MAGLQGFESGVVSWALNSTDRKDSTLAELIWLHVLDSYTFPQAMLFSLKLCQNSPSPECALWRCFWFTFPLWSLSIPYPQHTHTSQGREVTSIKPSVWGTKDFATILCHDQELHLLLCWGVVLLQQQELAVFAQNVIPLGAQNGSPWNIGKGQERGGDEHGQRVIITSYNTFVCENRESCCDWGCHHYKPARDTLITWS